MLHERALKLLPRSYKLWQMYLGERRAYASGCSVTDVRQDELHSAYERALVHLHKMPRIWLDYTATLVAAKRGTLTRRTFDRALQALPITQHARLWKPYLKWVRSFGVWQTAARALVAGSAPAAPRSVTRFPALADTTGTLPLHPRSLCTVVW